jgi:hypothetical protein
MISVGGFKESPTVAPNVIYKFRTESEREDQFSAIRRPQIKLRNISDLELPAEV